MLAFLPFLIWYFVYALAPEVSPDGTYYHLTYPKQYLEQHGFFPIVYNMYASLPQGLEMLFLPALAISGNFSSAALVHLSFLVLLAAAIVHYGEAKPHAWIAAFLIFASPVVGFDASIAYNDVALAACIFLTFVASTEVRPEAPRQAILAGVLAGFCFAIKYTGALAIPFAVAAVAMRTRTAKWPLLTLAAAMAIAGPWLLKNWIWLDNPVSPFFNRVFENPHVRVELEDQYRASMKRFGGHSLGAGTPLELTVRGGQLQGIAGPVFLLAPLAFLGSWRMALAGVFFAIPWTQNIGTRFLIPALPF
jgi:4-amino-4-deoxy-L-arabinose transferase-like glycosyltransferase